MFLIFGQQYFDPAIILGGGGGGGRSKNDQKLKKYSLPMAHCETWGRG